MATISLTKRKKIELKQKLASLQSEFGNWRDRSKAYEPLEKHQSQIHRVTLQLEGLNSQIATALDQLGDDGEGVLTQARALELAMLESHRVWEFFRSKLSLRSVEWFNKYLIAADELAWECYSAAQRKLDPNYLSKDQVKEPPLVFFNGGSSPFTMPRDFAFQAEVVPGEEIKSNQVIEILRALPIPVIGIPWFQVQHLPEMLVVAHEVGHDVESDFKLRDDVDAALHQAMAAAKIDDTRRQAWRAWTREIFADIYAVLSCGPAYVQSLMTFLATDPDKTMRAVRKAPKWGRYPTDYLRVLLNIEALDAKDFANERTQFLTQWSAVYPKHEMKDYEKDIETVVKAIINGPYTAFSGSTLNSVISFSPADQYHVNNDATQRLANGAAPQAPSVRVLFAAASTAFALDPHQYGAVDMPRLILNQVTKIRGAGVRGSHTTVGGKIGSLDHDDKAAGASLFKLLVKDQPGTTL